MKYLMAIAVATLLSGTMAAQGMEFFHGSWEEALAKADEEGKLIFVDCYTTWCGPCKRMSAQTFPDPQVGEFYNANFISLKIDMEKEKGLQFRRDYPVSAYPTLYYIDPDGKVVLMTKGAKQAPDFIAIGQSALKKYDGSAKYKGIYEEGDRSYETVYAYISALNKSGKSSVKVANEYFRTQDDLSTEENLEMLMVATTRVDSKIFGFFEEHKKELIKLKGESAVNAVIREAAYNTGAMGIEYETTELMDEAYAALKKHIPDDAEEFKVSSQMNYALHMGDVDMYAPNAKIFFKKFVGDDPEELAHIAQDVMKHFPDHADCVDLGLKASKKALQVEKSDKTVILYASMLYLDGDKAKAIEVIDDALADPGTELTVAKLKAARKQLEAA